MGSPLDHKYARRIVELQAEGKIPIDAGLYNLTVRHDDWCGIYHKSVCNCDPEFEIQTWSDPEGFGPPKVLR